MASPPLAKRRREAAPTDEDADAEDPRARACAAQPEFVTSAAAALHLSVGPEPVWAPHFTHQQFTGERVWGYRALDVRIRYSDPDLRVHVAARCEAAAPSPAHRADELADCLRASLPAGYPAAGLRVAVAAAGNVPAALDAFHPPPPDAPWEPPGPSIASYRLAGRTFSIHRWRLATPEARSYLDRMGTLAMWLIETASPVDCDDDAWTVYGLYEEEDEEEGGSGGGAAAAATSSSSSSSNSSSSSSSSSSQRRRFAGYATTYSFVTPFRRPRPNSLRLAQLLLLPRYQRHGHGSRLLDAIYADADAAGGGGGDYLTWRGPWLGVDAHEVTVEAPCEGMSRLRDAHDVARALASRAFDSLTGAPEWRGHQWATYPLPASVGAAAAVAAALPLRDVTAAELEPVRARLRCTLGQAHRVHEALLLASLLAYHQQQQQQHQQEHGGSARGRPLDGAAAAAMLAPGDEAVKPFRLAVKRRLLATDADLAAVGDVEARKALLEDGYQACWAQYVAALSAVRPAPLVPREAGAAALAALAAREVERGRQLEAQLAAAEASERS